jgi:hypothetical protein
VSGRRSKRRDIGLVSKLDALRAGLAIHRSEPLESDFKGRLVDTIAAWAVTPPGEAPATRFGTESTPDLEWCERLLAEIDDYEAAS